MTKHVKESLLIYFCGKNSQKKRKVLRILDGITYNKETKEYTCPSASDPTKKYIIIYSTKAFRWVCNCDASLWYQYRPDETPEQRNSYRNQKRCVHIVAVMMTEFLKHPQ